MLIICFVVFVFFKQKTAYEMRISDWSSDVCSSDLSRGILRARRSWRKVAQRASDIDVVWAYVAGLVGRVARYSGRNRSALNTIVDALWRYRDRLGPGLTLSPLLVERAAAGESLRPEEHTSDLQSLMRNSHAVFA